MLSVCFHNLEAMNAACSKQCCICDSAFYSSKTDKTDTLAVYNEDIPSVMEPSINTCM